MCELRLGREIRGRRLIITRSGPENIRNRLGKGAVLASKHEDAIRNSLSYPDAFYFASSGKSVGNWRAQR